MTPRQPEYHRLWGLDVEGERRLLPTWSKSEAGRHFIFNHLDPLAIKIGVERESLRGWYHECLLRGVHLVYLQGHAKAEDDAYWASVEVAAEAAPNEEAFRHRWSELAARETVRKERQLGSRLGGGQSDSTLHALFLQVHSGELGTWWPRFVAASTDADEPPGPLVTRMLRSMYGAYQLASAYDYVKWLAPQRAFVPTFDLPPGVEIAGHDQLSLMAALSEGYVPLPWEKASSRRAARAEQAAIAKVAALRIQMEDRVARRRWGIPGLQDP
jgi:hypothetical protein